MAPSRALIARITSAIAQPRTRPTSRLLSPFIPRTQQPRTFSALQQGRTRPSFASTTYVRSYSQQATAAPEPPHYLNEAELHIFKKIKGELDPVKLEVRIHYRSEIATFNTPIAAYRDSSPRHTNIAGSNMIRIHESPAHTLSDIKQRRSLNPYY
jgi:hypothetical protein